MDIDGGRGGESFVRLLGLAKRHLVVEDEAKEIEGDAAEG